jgi:hypothetical protein
MNKIVRSTSATFHAFEASAWPLDSERSAKSLGGRIEYGFGAQFSSFPLVFPLTERERRANRAVASRRAKEAESAVEASYRHEMKNAWELA